MRKFIGVAIAAIVIFAALQFVRPDIPAHPATSEIQVPANVRQVLNRSCYSCHSDQRRLAWFDEIVPGYWLVRHDILTARAHLDFSKLGSKPSAVQKATLYEAVNMIQLGAMPLRSFARLHPEARITAEDMARLKAYLDPWASAPPSLQELQSAETGNGHIALTRETSVSLSLSSVLPEFDGLPFDPDFENWKLISTTDRGDNNTLRFILGNDIALKAAQSGNISPWPDGTRFAKVAWQQGRGSDGLIYPGKFAQVELMVKDARRFRSTDGWGWGRWRGLNLQPYGANARFVQECTGCHMPVRPVDDVFTLPITLAHTHGEEVVNNRAASLPASLPWQPLQWSAITMFVDPINHTMAVLFGSDLAARAALPRKRVWAAPAYPEGAVLALVTWAQRNDPHWFGARIPDMPECVEFVAIGPNAIPSRYRRFAGTALADDHAAAPTAEQRMSFITNLPPAPMP